METTTVLSNKSKDLVPRPYEQGTSHKKTLRDLVQCLDSLEVDDLDISADANDLERLEALKALAKIQSRLEQPWETGMRLAWTTPTLTAALKICIDLALFEKWKEHGGGMMTVQDLALMTSSDADFLRRILRTVASMHALDETGVETYRMTPFAEALGSTDMKSMLPYFFEVNGPAILNLPGFCKSVQYQNPADSSKTNWQHYKQSKETPFEFLKKNPESLEHFQRCMRVLSLNMASWTILYPVEQLGNQVRKESPLVVDVGGGLGHDIKSFSERIQNLPPGSLILQDRPEVIAQAKVTPPIKAIAHDFFEPQPIKGAKVYYLHNVLHDWPEEKALKILQNLVPVMERGYSVLLVHDTIVTECQPDPMVCSLDITMMVKYSAQERTASTWRSMSEFVGLKLSNVYSKPGNRESVMEFVLA